MIVANAENQKEIRIAGDLEHVYADLYRPAGTRTKGEWLRQGYQISGVPTACLLRLHDAPKGNRRFPDEPIDPEVIQGLRERLEESGEPSHQNRNLITRLIGSNQAVWQNLYPFESVKPITRLSQNQAWELLVGLWRQGSDFNEHINQDPHRVASDGRKVLWTDASRWDHGEHKQGLKYFGPTVGSLTRMLVIDLDRHDAADLARFVERVLAVLGFLQREYDWLAPHVGAINPLNGSCHIVLYFPRAVPVSDARELATELRRECPAIGGAEIYPDNLSQVICPLRLDKHVIVDRVLAPCVKAHRWTKKMDRRGKWKRDRKVSYLAHDAVAYWEWVQDPDRKPCDLAAVERLLLGTAEERQNVASQSLGSNAVPSQSLGHGRVCCGDREKVRFRGNTARLLTGVFGGKLRPDDDTVTVYTTVALRCLRWVEGMDRDQAVDWVMGKLEALEDTSFSDRLTSNPRALRRNIEGTAKAIWGTSATRRTPSARPAPGEGQECLAAAGVPAFRRGHLGQGPAGHRGAGARLDGRTVPCPGAAHPGRQLHDGRGEGVARPSVHTRLGCRGALAVVPLGPAGRVRHQGVPG